MNDQKRALLAVVLSGIVLFGWQYFFAPKQAEQAFKTTEKVTEKAKTAIVENQNTNNNLPEEVEVSKDLQTYVLSNEIGSYEITNYLSISNALYRASTKRLKNVFPVKGESNELQLLHGDLYKPTAFNVEQLSDTELKVSNPNFGITGTVTLINDGKVLFNLSSIKPFGYRFLFTAKEESGDNGSTRNFAYFTNEFDTTTVGDDDRGDTEFKWFGLDYDYHLLAYVLEDKKPLVYNITENGKFSLSPSKTSNQLMYKGLFVQKDYDHLINLGDNLKSAIDFGILSIISVPILRGLQFFFDLIPNYGISIILLTLIIRLLTFPLQYKSFKSMKKMQVIQPELQKVREKYKDNPQKMQQETMLLFKRAGANPLGGCLPLVLQMPIFFAFYKVLNLSVELVGAPFFGWITDLSIKDPYYILPILMASAMFFQQKLTPTASADPMQQKVMMFMPLIFGLIMKDLPSGLSLYILVSTVFGMAQQLFVYRRV
jgi:YidC/Oxa1 family membrane protein insertase